MNAVDLYSEVRATPEVWRCREATAFMEHLCQRRRDHDGDHAEVHEDAYGAVTIWPQT
jgi:hypothetical protein